MAKNTQVSEFIEQILLGLEVEEVNSDMIAVLLFHKKITVSLMIQCLKYLII